MTNLQKLIEKLIGEDLKEYIRRNYVEEGKTLEEIGESLGVSFKSIHRWVNEFEFHQKRPPWNKGLTKKEREQVLSLTERSD